MRRILVSSLLFAALVVLGTGGTAADSRTINFESYTPGNINGQDGWSKTGGYDVEVATVATFANASGFGFGDQALRISNSVTSGSFGDQALAPGLTDAASETDNQHFHVAFEIGSTLATEQSGLYNNFSPDDGQGSRMSFIGFKDLSDGIHVTFNDATNPGPLGATTTFNETEVALFDDRTLAHEVELDIYLVPGAANDVVRVYVDDVLVHEGGSWEDYYRYDLEQQGNGNQVPSIDTMLFRAGGGGFPAVPGNAGNGYLVDNLTYYTEDIVQCTTTCYVNATNGDDVNGGGTEATAKKTIQAAVDQVSAGGTIHVAAGDYHEDVLVVDANVSLIGDGLSTTRIWGVPGGNPATVRVSAMGVLIDGFTITREGNNTTDWDDPTLNSAGVAVQGQTVSVEVRNTLLTGNRTGIDINNSNGSVIHNSFINDNRTGMIMRNQTDNMSVYENEIKNNWTVGVLFLDASSGSNVPVQTAANSHFNNNDISGNWYGQVVDRQSGGSLPAPGTTNLKDFSSNWYGTTEPVVSNANSAEPGYSALIPTAYGGSSTPPGGQPDILGPAVDNIDFTPLLNSGTDSDLDELGFQGAFDVLNVRSEGAQTGADGRIQEAVDLVTDSIVNVGPGDYAETVVIDHEGLELRGANYGISPNDSGDPLQANAGRGAESTIAVTGGDIAISVQAEDVVIDGFRFTATGVSSATVQSPVIGGGVNFGGDASGIVVQNNLFDAIQKIAVYFNGPDNAPMDGAKIDDNRVDQPTRPETGCNTAPTSAPGNCARQLFNPWKTDNLSFQRNVVVATDDNLDRVRVLNFNGGTSGGGDVATIADNSIRYACHYTCITVAGTATDVEIKGNDIVSQHGNAVQLYSDWSGGNVDVHHNLFNMTNNDFAFVVDNTSAVLTGVHVNRNSFASRGVRNGTDVGVPGTNTLDATCNWWAQATGPDQTFDTESPFENANAPDAFGPTDFVPWLITSDLDGDCTEISLGDAATDANGNEGDLLTASGSFSNPAASIDADEPFGTFTDNGDGTWDWSYTPPDQFSTVTITVTATDPNGSTATDSFDTSALNVDPTGTLNAPASALYDSGFNISLSGATDAGADDVTAGFTYAFDCGTGYGATSGTSSANCTAPSDPGDITVKGKVFDKDGGFTEYTAEVEITQPEATLTPASHDFGDQVVGQASTPFSFTLENTGTADLTVLAVALGGSNPAHFGIDTNGCAGAVLEPEDTCDIAVIFQPSSLGAKAATLRVTTNDPDLAIAISDLEGSGGDAADPGSIRIVVDSRPNNKLDFAFAGDLGSFILDDDSNATRQRGRTYLNLAPGEYEITQTTDPAAWSLVAIDCTNPAAVDLGTRTVTIDLDSNEDIVCTFVNSRRKPDGLISKNNSSFKGGNKYSTTAVKAQTQKRNNVKKNTIQKFYVRAQNDSQNADVLRIDANETGVATMSISYWVNGVDQTAAIVAGTYVTSSLNQNQYVTIEIRVAVGNSVNNAARTALVYVSSDSRPAQVDVVRAVTKR